MDTRTGLFWGGVLAATVGAGASGQAYQRFLGEPPNVREHQHSNAYTNDDGVVTAGFYFRVPAAGGPFAPEQFVTRHRDDGALLWSRRYASQFQTEFATSIRPVGGGAGGGNDSFIVGGFSYPTTIDVNVSMMRLDGLGNVMWAGNYFGGSQAPDPVSLPPEQWASVRGAPAFDLPVDRGIPVVPAGFALVTTWVPFQAGPAQGEFIRVDGAGNLVSMRLHAGPTIFQGSQVAFTDLRHDPVNNHFVVAATLLRRTQPIPGGPLVDERYPMYVRLDAFGNFITAYAYFIPSGAQDEAVDSRGWSIEIDGDTSDVFLSGPTNFFGSGVAGAFVMRITPAGVPVWVTGYKEFAPAVATLSRDRQKRVAISGTERGVPGSPVPSLIAIDSGVGATIFRRIYFPPGTYRGTDAVALEGPRDGWAVVGLATSQAEDLHILRTDGAGKTGCFEQPVDPRDAAIQVDLTQLALVQAVQDIFFFRTLDPVDPMTPQNPLCVGRCACPGDADGNGVVDFNDIVAVNGNWGAVYGPGTGPGDANCDGVVDFNDIVEVLGNWGAVCP